MCEAASITKYILDDRARTVKVILELDGLDKLCRDNFRLTSGDRNIELTIDLTNGDTCTFVVKELFQEITGAELEQKKGRNQVVLRLTKKDATPWGQLSSGEAPTEIVGPPDPRIGQPIDAPVEEVHGSLGDATWALPTIVRPCDDQARPGYQTGSAHEYRESAEVLEAKVKKVAELVRRSKNMIAYTGAGISTSSGIADYASIASGSVAVSSQKVDVHAAQPTVAHRALVAMYNAGQLKHWVQQNHDGLPQKAGFPQKDLNEIHGAWYDPSNPVVAMSGVLRSDLVAWKEEWTAKADLCLTIGTSLAGMSADSVPESIARRASKGDSALGTVIVGLQRTRFDHLSCVRVFGTIDEFMEKLTVELGLEIPDAPPHRPWSEPPVLRHLPYSRHDGSYNPSEKLTLDLRPGSKVRIIDLPEWNKKELGGDICEVVQTSSAPLTAEGHIVVQFLGTQVRRRLGRWWLDAAVNGAVPVLPVVPCE